ncbi:hypothetical protein MNBD_GAMMA15-1214 [hydrothermal vent metagenome]|uniref:Type 4 fimbrial biogenesis protein PilX N-terminal domain-containing protein n=1 Tax=hydrothermal vent metagenome TaxID=652676 RepID=A0A3B0ZDP8_9ZZZZ
MTYFISDKKQSGAALVVSLLILLVMTLLGVSSLQTSTMEEKMAGNTRERQQAFEAAEAAIIGAELFVKNNIAVTSNFDTDGSDGLYDNVLQERWKTVAWSATDSLVYSGYTSDYSAASQPRYIIEHYGTTTSSGNQYNLSNYGQGAGGGEVELFRITVRGTGADDRTPVFLQTTYGKIL